jgi:hypothetical protein
VAFSRPAHPRVTHAVGRLNKDVFVQKLNEMDTIEIPRFLLSYFDSTTIRTPLSSIMGHSRVMLKGLDGPITERQQEDLEIVFKNAEFLMRFWGVALRAIRYIAYKPEIQVYQVNLDDLISQCKERVNFYSAPSIEIEIPTTKPAIWTDLVHTESVFDCIGWLTHDVYRRATGKLVIKISQSVETTTLEFQWDKTEFTKSEDFNLSIEPYCFIIQSVMSLHGGQFDLINDAPNEKLLISLGFPEIHQARPNV